MRQTHVLVAVDVGVQRHRVAIGTPDKRLARELDVEHTPEGLAAFFRQVEAHTHGGERPVAVAMEGYNGHARPLDAQVLARGWRLFNVNNLKLASSQGDLPGPGEERSHRCPQDAGAVLVARGAAAGQGRAGRGGRGAGSQCPAQTAHPASAGAGGREGAGSQPDAGGSPRHLSGTRRDHRRRRQPPCASSPAATRSRSWRGCRHGAWPRSAGSGRRTPSASGPGNRAPSSPRRSPTSGR